MNLTYVNSEAAHPPLNDTCLEQCNPSLQDLRGAHMSHHRAIHQERLQVAGPIVYPLLDQIMEI